MKNKRTELIVGITAICATVILISGLIFLKEFRFNRDMFDISILFDNASGLKEGDAVMVSGVKTGVVKSISLQQGGVRIDLRLQPDVRLYQDASFIVTSSGLVGMKYVEVNPGRSSQPLDVSGPIQGKHQHDAFEVVAMMGALISEMRQLVDKIDQCVTEDGLLGVMSQTLTEARALMSTIRTVVDENRGDLHEAVRDFQSTSKAMKHLVEDNRAAIDTTVARFRASSERFDTTLLQLEEMSSSLQGLTNRIDLGDGTLGQLINNRELYDDLQNTTREINLLIEDIRKDPGKYLKISVFDF